SDKNLIALREQLKAKYLDSPDQFNFYLRKNIDACKGCWDINEGQQKTVKTYLATVLLIYASDVLCKRKKRIDFNSKRIIKTSLTLPIS
ncbi:MAG: hypothetical protein KAT65_15155, partial [Methanophagales archaeon]|nr:hypothetical protein [Methanophagales archaeon]